MTPALHRAASDSGFSRLDFRTKLAVFAAVSLTAALWDDVRLGLGLAVATLLLCLVARVSVSQLWTMGKAMLPIFIVMVLTHGFFNVQLVESLTGRASLTPLLTIPPVWWAVGGRILSLEGLLYGINVLLKSATFLLLIPLCVSTTETNNIVSSLVKLRVPYTISFVIASTLRFFPLLFEEVNAVIETQRLRGFALEEMGVFRRVGVYAKIAVPVTLGALHKAQQVEVAFQAKAFSGSRKRTYLHESRLGTWDVICLAASALTVLIVPVLYGSFGIGRFWAG